MKRFNLILILSLWLGWASVSFALTVPLNYATGVQEQTVLRGESQSIDIPFELLQNEAIESLELTLAIYNNNPILSTQLWLYQAEQPLAKVELDQVDQYQFVTMELPRNVFRGAKAVLSLRIKHVLPENGGWVDSSQLVTTISNTDSFYRLASSEEVQLGSQTLASFETALRNGYFHQHHVELQPLDNSSTMDAVAQAAMLVQGLTLRAGFPINHLHYAPTTLTEHLETRSGDQNNPGSAQRASQMESQSTSAELTPKISLWFGTHAQMLSAKVMVPNQATAIQGAYLGLHPDSTTAHIQLLFSGRNVQEVNQAIRFFAEQTLPLPNQASTAQLPHSVLAPTTVKPAKHYPISAFSAQQNLTGVPLNFKLHIPSNTMMGDEDFAKINLLLTHPQVDPGQGNLVVRVDGEYASSVRLRSSLWRNNQHYRLNIPMTLFKAGVNQISIEVFGPAQQSHNPQAFPVTMGQESNIILAPWVDYVPLPSHRVSSEDFISLSDHFGARAQIIIDSEANTQVHMLWHILSSVVLSTEQPLPFILYTDQPLIERPFSIDLTRNGQRTKRVAATDEVNRSASLANLGLANWLGTDLRERLFDVIAPSLKDPTRPTQAMALPVNDAPFAHIYSLPNSDWYGIALQSQDPDQWHDFVLTETESLPKGRLSEQIYAAGFDQLFTALFWGYPALLTMLVMGLIWTLAWIIAKKVERR